MMLSDAVHICLNDTLAGLLRHHGVPKVEAFCERFSVGPVHVDAEEFSRARRRLWREGATIGHFSIGDLRSVLARRDEPVVIWSGRAWSEMLSVWWILRCLGERVVDESWFLVDLAEYGGPEGTASVCFLPSNRIENLFEERVRVDEAVVAEAAILWDAFAEATPRRLQAVDWDIIVRFSYARRSFRRYACALPERRGSQVYLSPNDRVLLSSLSVREWRGLSEIVRRDSEQFMELLLERGDIYVGDRLNAFWGHPLLEVEARSVEYEGGGGERLQWRLSRRGRAHVSRPLPDIEQIPSDWIGGYRAYRPPIWVSRMRADDWSVEAHRS